MTFALIWPNLADCLDRYLYFEVIAGGYKGLASNALKILDAAGYMVSAQAIPPAWMFLKIACGCKCYDHAGQWPFEKDVFRPAGYAADAVPGDRMVLSNGLKW